MGHYENVCLTCYVVLSDAYSDDKKKIVAACRNKNCPYKTKPAKRPRRNNRTRIQKQ